MSFTRTLAPRLPLSTDKKFGYSMLTTIKQTTKQNLKCLLLTAPGERMMDPEFGVGIRKFLFENESPQLNTEIKINIRQQVAKYMPFINIKEVLIQTGDEIKSPAANDNTIYISLKYGIKSIGTDDILNLALRND